MRRDTVYVVSLGNHNARETALAGLRRGHSYAEDVVARGIDSVADEEWHMRWEHEHHATESAALKELDAWGRGYMAKVTRDDVKEAILYLIAHAE